MLWDSHFSIYSPQLDMFDTIKGFSVIKEAQISLFWYSLAISFIQHTSTILQKKNNDSSEENYQNI